MVELLLIRLFIRKLRTEIPERTRTESIDGPFVTEGFLHKNHLMKIAVFRIPIWVLTFLIWWEVPLELKEEIPCKDLIQSYSGSGKFSFFHNYAC